ncbi:YhdP family protein [Mesorhizobium sp. L-8-3]|uniref:YhdP family protein n=1 Tax=Mesorhizobium sp. L-8-3 TaxID=2744522 RepID=UPI001925A572|nr:DUF3971 domain-containing protein [Mesorhizobium sp. L-8-3]BCH24765.1 hypothetical protein MesoLjLb_45500 [Mesorhizobium sp. L-8-3]
MEQELQRHEKVRFRREDITGLHTFPSAIGQDFWTPRRPLHRQALGFCAGALAAVVAIIAFVVGAIYFVGISGISSDSLRGEAEAAVERLLGADVVATLGPARLSFDSSRFLAVEMDDVRFAVPGTGKADIIEAGSVRFGIRVLPLLSGELKLGNARIADATIAAAAMPAGDGVDWMAPLANKDGLLDPDRLVDVVFAGVHRALDVFGAGSTRSIELDNITVAFPDTGSLRRLEIARASLHQSLTGGLVLSAELAVDGREIAMEGTASRDKVTRRVDALDFTVSSPGLGVPTPPAPEGAQETRRETAIGDVGMKITGAEGIGGEASRLAVALTVGDSVVRIDPRNHSLDASLTMAATMISGSGKLEIERATLISGRSHFRFHGAVGPKPRSDPAEAPVYRYELVSDGSTLAPPDSPEPSLSLVARLGGTYDAAARHLEVKDIGVRTQGGEMLGTAAFDFVPGKSPGMFLALTLPDMPASHVKQLWPWVAAAPARRWALGNLFGGHVSDGRLQFRVPPGRIGNGVPLSGDEISGQFRIAGTRFDLTGRVPPMRDAVGTIDFRGNEVDIALSSGSVYLPSGRTVAASNGTLTIRKANVPKVIGALDMNVAGDAQAVAELASYEPIDAMRRIGMTADEFSGEVSGNVKADIPLSKAAQGEKLDWIVALDFKNLALTRAFDGQLATEADGTITIDPTKAVIDAKAKLNGAPADIDIVEPIGGSDVGRARDITITLDDKAREKLAPGLSTLVSGPVKLAFSSGSDNADRHIEADLTGARLDIPWAGWSKGPGVAAEASFRMRSTGGTTTLSDFKLGGKSFAIAGEIVLNGGELSSARFDTAQLNRGDDVRVTIKRNGKGYQVDVRGRALDARSLVRQFTSDAKGTEAASGSSSVSVTADVKSLIGFHGERFSDVKLDYAGKGSRVVALKVSAVTSGGKTVTVSNGTDGGRRTMEMHSADAGAVLRFLDIYQHMEGGTIRLALSGEADGPMRGQMDATDFWVVDEPRLASIVATTPPGDDRSLNQAVKRNIDTSRVKFERGFAVIDKAPGSLVLDHGMLRGPLIGLMFQGTLYDKASKMNMTGTFMPAYGLNRIFGEIPLVGQILGNGRDRGLIGVTFRLSGDANSPTLQINPLSVIAPGIFRSIFEFR